MGAMAGPLIVQEYDSTVVIPPDCTASLDSYGNIVIDVREIAPLASVERM
jgi:N-methylhydantoinase A/oxoprolinase/acetone carboxylase beta subunit